MVNEARSHEADDQRRRAEVETRNQADTLVYSTEKMLQDNADKIPQDLKEEVETKISVLKNAISANNIAEMQTAIADLNNSVQKIGQAVYSQTAGPRPTDGAADETPPEEEQGGSTVEGEFREV